MLFECIRPGAFGAENLAVDHVKGLSIPLVNSTAQSNSGICVAGYCKCLRLSRRVEMIVNLTGQTN